MNFTLDVRTTCNDDVTELRQLIVTTWHDTYDRTIGPERVREITDSWHATDKLADELQNPDCTSLVAVNSGVIAGHGLVLQDGSGEAWLSRLYVLPRYQGLGVGKQLLQQLEAHSQNCHILRLEVEESNEQARAFYARHGFEEVERKSSCGDQSEIPTWIVEKPLHIVVTNNNNIEER